MVIFVSRDGLRLGWISTVVYFLRGYACKFKCVHKIEAIIGRSRVNVKAEPRSTFIFTYYVSCIASIFTRVNFT